MVSQGSGLAFLLSLNEMLRAFFETEEKTVSQ